MGQRLAAVGPSSLEGKHSSGYSVGPHRLTRRPLRCDSGSEGRWFPRRDIASEKIGVLQSSALTRFLRLLLRRVRSPEAV